MEENENTLLQIDREENGVASHWHGQGAEDMFAIALAIADYARRNTMFMMMLLGVIKESLGNDEFRRELDDSVIEMPNFNSILKDEHNN